MSEIHKAAVLGATGTTGPVIVRELLERGATVRVVSRSHENLARMYEGVDVERLGADVEKKGECDRAIEGCDVVFDCLGFPMTKFEKHVSTARTIVQLAKKTGARVVLMTGYWSSAPCEGEISNTPPTKASNSLSGCRIEQERVVVEAGGCAVVLPDFYGPRVRSSVLNDGVKTVLAGEKTLWPGDPWAKRGFVYIPDLGRPAVDLAMNDEAFGKRWIVAGDRAQTPAELLERAASIIGQPLMLKRISPMAMKLASMFQPGMRAFSPVYPIYNAPAIYDDAATRKLIGDWPVTSNEDGLAATIDWLREEGTKSG